ncbi:MAG: DUF192 domain-containing protein [Pseudomonadota bacterium]|jgi:uncharacterized membrane protein (UPF0127 family)|nr:DUF192 domain-containing protein [Rubrivivax sp.]MCA3258230.1 DUF192 domain-containing protein [Rubrivivax sp.]MCZ8030689.1 DUF192 domain-containing protein [Rubrivivax sp.]
MTFVNPRPTLSRGARAALAACLAMAAAASAAQTGPQPRLPTVPLQAGMHVIQAELAVTPEQQAVGMMGRREIPGNEGMLFVNDSAGVRCFWMRNTLVPITIAFIADDGTIVNLADMEPLSERSHCSTRPVRFALEMSRGWFAKRGIQAGFRLRGAPFGS